MFSTMTRWVLALSCAAMLVSSSAWARIQVSVTITGNLDEMVQLLQQLQTLGLLGAAGSDPIQLNVHSVTSSQVLGTPQLPAPGEAPAPTPASEAAPTPPTPPAQPESSIADFAIETTSDPAIVLVTVHVRDAKNAVDTVGGTSPSLPGMAFDFFDNGSNGDATAKDGVWTARVPIASVPAGEHEVTIRAYNANGEVISHENEAGAVVPLEMIAIWPVQKEGA